MFLQVRGLLDQLADVDVGRLRLSFGCRQITSSHAQVLDELVGVFAFLAGGVEEELGESWAVHAVLGEESSHRQILQRRRDFHLDLFLCVRHALVLHVHEVDALGRSLLEKILRIAGACKVANKSV